MLLDLTNQSFVHSHLYMASFYNIMIFCNQDQIYNDGAVANSIVYRNILISFPNGMEIVNINDVLLLQKSL